MQIVRIALSLPHNTFSMTVSEFFKKFASKYLWGNLLAMAIVVILVAFGVKFGLDLYTHHGESIAIPQLVRKSYDEAIVMMQDKGLKIEVGDTGYVKNLPPNFILEQYPAPGVRVKSGHLVVVTINASEMPTITFPDIIDNCSMREAVAKLMAMGFKMGKPEFIPGEKDWVYGVRVNGRNVVYGDRIPVGAKLIVQVGNGQRDSLANINYIDPVYPTEDEFGEVGMTDDFIEVTEPPVEQNEQKTHTSEKPVTQHDKPVAQQDKPHTTTGKTADKKTATPTKSGQTNRTVTNEHQ